ADALAAHRKASRTSGARLAEAWVNVAGTDAATMNAAYGQVRLPSGTRDLTNAMLVELFTSATSTGASAQFATILKNEALDLAPAGPPRQRGPPAGGATPRGYDLHGGEISDGPPLYTATARMAGALAWLLGKMPDPQTPGRTMLDRTLFVTIT